jgi:hypothetical protein
MALTSISPEAFARSEPHRGAGSRLVHAIAIAVGALALSLFFHTPHLWMFAQPVPGSVYWDRGLQFIQQCDSPLGAPLTDAGLAWRIAPVLLAKGLGLHGYGALVIPWLGLLLLLAQCAWIVMHRTSDARFAAIATALVGTTTATLQTTCWLGINDAWYAAALVAIALQPARALLIIAAIVGPWIDERFILAVPLALLIRHRTGVPGSGMRLASMVVLVSLVAYFGLRGGNVLHLTGASSQKYWNYVLGGIPAWWPWVSIGWFAGLRAGWLLVIFALGETWRAAGGRIAAALGFFALAPMAVMSVLASDSSRSPTMLLPLLLLGILRLRIWKGETDARRILGAVLLANLVLPAMIVTYQNVDVINLFPVEAVRWIRHH